MKKTIIVIDDEARLVFLSLEAAITHTVNIFSYGEMYP
jgi:hypothetical protein